MNCCCTSVPLLYGVTITPIMTTKAMQQVRRNRCSLSMVYTNLNCYSVGSNSSV